MTATTSSHAFAAASSSMVRGVDAASIVHVLIADGLSLLNADTAGILVRTGDDELELLAATSHEATELELHQAQTRNGPCCDTVKTGYPVAASGDDILERWPIFGPTMHQAGFQAVHAIPLQWHTHVLGGLNLFWSTPRQLSDDDARTAQAFGDICTLALMQSPRIDDTGRLDEHLRTALEGRVVIERAKGVLGQLDDLDMADAFHRLLQLSEEAQLPLTTTATMIVNRTSSS